MYDWDQLARAMCCWRRLVAFSIYSNYSSIMVLFRGDEKRGENQTGEPDRTEINPRIKPSEWFINSPHASIEFWEDT